MKTKWSTCVYLFLHMDTDLESNKRPDSYRAVHKGEYMKAFKPTATVHTVYCFI